MTRKLYYESAYEKVWWTNIIDSIERDGKYFIILEETAFYPHGGGQPCDLGSIDGIKVLDVFSEDGEVVHQVERLPETDKVICKLDWERRFDHMQNHSGQHLLSAVFRDLLQAQTVSFHLGTEDVTIDIDQSDITNDQLTVVEQEVNNRIYQNLEISSYFVSNEQLRNIPVVKMPKVTENIRIVEIEGVEYNACGGTHVTRTGQIAMIKLFKAEKLKGATRVHFKCGNRALADYNKVLAIIDTLSEKFNTGRKDILDRFEKWEQGYKQIQTELSHIKEQNEAYLSKELLSNMEGKLVSHVFADKSLKDMQRLAAKIVTDQAIIVLLATTAENKILLYHSGSEHFSCGKLFKEHLPAFNGKGGGNDQSAQAGFPSNEDSVQFYEFIKKQV
ncbi:alanyl-tRNA editing protein [Oceanobacillus chungangensis]|uniref:Hydrolase n=1 Tax=Oceanobacillus chungangensis TaxID=1229152 RepID=A0A3D8Q1G7_9BACI|nr:DHHA1 domain-containing protein [Oceanobacillus chungangensis]RDW21249.1 hydrolase [Oceanobacillus chungangensis]